jgi:mono/diheme cytochrome c family protein
VNSSIRSLGVVAGLALPMLLGCSDVPQTIRPNTAGSGGVAGGAGTAGTGALASGGSASGGASGTAGSSGAGSSPGGSAGAAAGTGGAGASAGTASAGGAGAGGSSGFGNAGSSSGGAGAGGTAGSAGGGAAGTAGTGEITPEGYYADVCGDCHGANGEGAEDGPELQHPFDDFATWVIRNGRTGHPDYEDDMAEYGPTSLPEPILTGILEFLSEIPQPTSGEGLYADYCANCHGADGTGGVTGIDISREPLAELIEHARAGAHPGEFANREEFMPAFDESVLSDAEIGLISQYLSSL